MDYSQLARGAAGMIGGMGQGMMDNRMRQTFGAGRTGGFRDLMENQHIGDFVIGDNTDQLVRRWQDLQGKMLPARRGLGVAGQGGVQ